MNIWYRVTNLEAAQDFYKRTFGFEEVYKDQEDIGRALGTSEEYGLLSVWWD